MPGRICRRLWHGVKHKAGGIGPGPIRLHWFEEELREGLLARLRELDVQARMAELGARVRQGM